MKTLFSFEVPIKHLDDFNDLQDFHFTLHALYDNPAYKQFYLKERKHGLKTIWLDNGYNESMKAVKWSDLLAMHRHVGATRIISPDDPSWSTTHIADEFLKLVDYLPAEQIIVVVSSPKMLKEMRAFGAKNFALSYWVRPKLTDDELHDMMCDGKICHFLGLNSIQEIRKFRPQSCDTSMPIKLAMKGKNLMQWEAEGYPHIHTKDLGLEGCDYFNASLTASEIRLARLNIIDLKGVCNG